MSVDKAALDLAERIARMEQLIDELFRVVSDLSETAHAEHKVTVSALGAKPVDADELRRRGY